MKRIYVCTLRLSGSSVLPAYPGFMVMKMPQLGLHLMTLPMNMRDSLWALRAFRIESTCLGSAGGKSASAGHKRLAAQSILKTGSKGICKPCYVLRKQYLCLWRVRGEVSHGVEGEREAEVLTISVVSFPRRLVAGASLE